MTNRLCQQVHFSIDWRKGLLDSIPHSPMSATLFDIDTGTQTADCLRISQGLNPNCIFRRRSPRMSFLPGNLTPAYRSPWCAHIVAALHRKAYPIRTVMQFSKFSGACQVHCSEKIRPFPYIQEDGKGRQIGVISTLMDGGSDGDKIDNTGAFEGFAGR